MKDNLEATKRKIVETVTAIETLDVRRDAEVGVLLSEMGINLTNAAAAAKSMPAMERSTPLFESGGDGEENDGEERSIEVRVT